jgi:hypothetical protein
LVSRRLLAEVMGNRMGPVQVIAAIFYDRAHSGWPWSTGRQKPQSRP